MNIKVVANVLQFLPTIGKLWANSIINRRKQTKVFCVCCALQSIEYGLLGAYRGMGRRNIIIVRVFKENLKI